MQEIFEEEYNRRLCLVLKSKQNDKNEVINTWAVAILQYGAGMVKWMQGIDGVRSANEKDISAWSFECY